jgi:hypothetical protein
MKPSWWVQWTVDNVFRYWHNWASVWALGLLTAAVILKASDGVVMALAGLVGASVGFNGLVHGWKETTRIRQGNGTSADQPPPAEPEPRPQ